MTHTTPSGTGQYFKQDIHLHADHLILPHHMPFMLMPSKPVYILPTKLKMSLIPKSLAFYIIFQCQHYEYCRLLADGMRIFHMECCYSFITILDRGPRPHHPWYNHRMCLHYIFLHIYKSHPMPAV